MKKQLVIALSLLLAPLTHAAIPKKLNAFSEGDRLVYTKLVEAYRKNQRAEVINQRRLLEKNYPQSVHLDNAYYLNAMLDFQEGRMADAVRGFGVVRERFPKSNKRPAAMLAMAMSYQKLGLRPQSVRVLNLIRKEYPGSPESVRAGMHLRMEKVNSVKR
ncbi:MAG TPA: tetratricopeptide repeat protein [Bdellovibrionales bacterium]|nr:tetratricopeptide repeat protein [Bdellovibrionales bacterium]